jgi:hypothetical protein
MKRSHRTEFTASSEDRDLKCRTFGTEENLTSGRELTALITRGQNLAGAVFVRSNNKTKSKF